MRVVFVTPEYITEKSFDGGLANYLGRICPLLSKMGHDVSVVVASDRQEEILKDGVAVYRVPLNSRALFWLNKSTCKSFKSAATWLWRSWGFKHICAKIHRDSPIDIIQYASFSATGLFRLKGVPAVVRLSSYEPFWQKAYDWPTNLDNRLRARLEAAAIKGADAAFGPSRLISMAVANALGKPVEIIEPPFSLNRTEWDAQPYIDILQGKKYLLFFGTLGTLKGVHTIAEIIRPCLEKNPGYSFVFIGKDFGFRGRAMIDHVREKAGPFCDRVVYLGQMHQNQIYPVLSHAELVVLPSLVDNLPNACLEAMASERVVIGTRGASFEQLIEDGKSGFLCPPSAPEELLETIEKALALSPSSKERIGRKAAKRIAALSPENTVAQLIGFYRSTISRGRD